MFKSSSNQITSKRDSLALMQNSVEDLLSLKTEWIGVNDIIRLTLRGLSDGYKQQAELIKNLEKIVQTKVPKSEFMSQMVSKANTSDVNRTFNELSYKLDQKINFEEQENLIKDYATRNELNSVIKQQALEFQLSQEDFLQFHQKDLNSQLTKLEDIIFKRIQIQNKEIEQINRAQEQFEQKMKENKQTIQKTLSRLQLMESKPQSSGEDIQSIFQQKLQIIDSNVYKISMASDEKFQQIQIELMQTNETFKNQIEQFSNQLSMKINKSDGDRIQSQVDKKINEKDFQSIILQIKQNNQEDLNVLKNEIQYSKKHIEEYLQERIKKYDLFNQRINEQLVKLREGLKQSIEKLHIEIEEFIQNSQSQKWEFSSQLESISHQIEDSNKQANDLYVKKDFEQAELVIKIERMLEQKVDVMEIQNAFNSSTVDLSLRLTQLRDDLSHMILAHDQELLTLINKKAGINDLTAALSQKVDQNVVNAALRSLVSHSDLQQTNKLNETVANELQNKCDLRDFQEFSTRASGLLEELTHLVHEKATLKEIVQVLDKKSNHEEVARAFSEVQRELVRKANIDEVRRFQEEQSVVNESLCSENIVGRWIFKQGPLCSGSLVPWNVQGVNTLPDNYLWEKDRPYILVVAGGLYQLSLGFYAKKKPKVDVLLNGEIVMGAVSSGSYVIHHSSGKIKDVKHQQGCVTGLTLIDFIQVPARARISVAYSGDLGEGFIGIKRL